WLAHGEQNLVPLPELTLKGRHNALNALAALALVDALGIDGARFTNTVRAFRGLAHRMAQVVEVGGIAFINDSKSTTVASTVAALVGLDRKSVLIAGGDGKGQDFTPLVPVVRNHARAVVLLGRDAPILERALRAAGVDLVNVANIEEAVRRAFELAQPGDAVLLSPACASWDMFRDYVDRGNRFVSAVRSLPLGLRAGA
ncbi:MAG: cyanophycin synthetase, partial [Betaproteobacteria bacterium]